MRRGVASAVASIPSGTYVEPASTSAVRVSEPPPHVFLSPTGDDSFDGRWDRPKATLAAALTAAANGTVHVAGVHNVSSVPIVGPVNIDGQGANKAELRNLAGTVLAVAGSKVNVSNLTVRSAGGAPAIVQTAGVGECHWHHVRLIQQHNDHPVWDNAGFEMIDMRFDHGYSQHLQSATVPAWKLVAPGGTLNDNVWEKWRAQESGNYHWWMEATGANAQYSNTWRDITFEVCTGGGIKLISVRDYLIENCPNWDMNAGSGGITTGKRHFFAFERNASTISCVGTIRRQQRLAGTNDPGILDISLPAGGGGAGTIIERCRNISGADPYTIDLAGNNALVTASDAPNTALTNATAAVVLANSRVSIGAVDFTTGTATPEGAVTASPGSIYARTSGAGAPAFYVKMTGTGNTGWADQRVPPDGSITAAKVAADVATQAELDAAVALRELLDPDRLTSGEATMRRREISTSAVSLASGFLRLAYFTARKSETVNSLRLVGGSTAAAATPTLVRAGLYTVAGNGDITLVADIANDTAIFATLNTAYTRALTTPYAKVAGQRYAVGVLVVTGAAAPTACGQVVTVTTETAEAPRLAASVSGQTDLPASVLAASIVNSGQVPYVALVP